MQIAIGALLIIAACVLAGNWGAQRLEVMRQRLLDAGSGLQALAREIDYLATPLPEALAAAAAAAGLAAPLFTAAAAHLNTGVGVSGSEAWRAALAETAPLWTESAAAALATAADGLGETDAAGQVKKLELTRERLAVCEAEAAEKAKRFGKIWRSMGWAAGAMLVLLMI